MISAMVLFIAYLFVFPGHAQAYLDPGTGSYITQVLIGFLVGGVYVGKTYWRQLTAFLKNLLRRKPKDETPKDD